MRAHDQSSIFSTGGKFRPWLWASIGVTRSYSSHPFLCALDTSYTVTTVSSTCSLSVPLLVMKMSRKNPITSLVAIIRKYLHTCACCCIYVLAAAIIQGQRLFHSELLIVRLLFQRQWLFEGSNYSKKYSTYFFDSILNHPFSNRGLPLPKGEGLKSFRHPQLLC